MNTDNSRNGTFDYAEYRRMINAFKDSGYVFEKFTNAEKLLAHNKSFVLMRHDVDVDVELAYKMALIEQEMGVKAIYFLLLRTDHYNLFSASETFYVNEILRMGHEIGIHFDNTAYPEKLTIDELNVVCQKEVAILENWFETKITTISYHRPNKLVLEGSPALTTPLIHSYMMVFRDKIKYFADSRGMWRYGNPLDSDEFKAGKPIHIDIHPVWWSDKEIPANDMLNENIRKKNNIIIDSFRNNFVIFEYNDR